VQNRILTLATIIFVAAGIFQECSTSTPTSKKYSYGQVVTYAELLVLHEREKMVYSTPDSIYRNRVNQFFSQRKIAKEEFEKRIIELSRDNDAWRSFLMEATVAVDSIKSAKPV